MSKLKTIAEHQLERHQAHQMARESSNKTNVACPKCGNEIVYTDAMILTSYPPQRNVHCEKCDYQGHIYA